MHQFALALLKRGPENFMPFDDRVEASPQEFRVKRPTKPEQERVVIKGLCRIQALQLPEPALREGCWSDRRRSLTQPLDHPGLRRLQLPEQVRR